MNAVFAADLLAWFDLEGRKHLPWQWNPTPYRVWISEIMLQQTQVVTVIPYYERFLQRFPDIGELANAELDEVLHLWAGLGYYARARNLHRAARIIEQEYQGKFPDTLDAVQALPGIGRSTAGAILALASAQRHPILDGNVKRVLTRYFGVEGFPGEKKIEAQLWQLADACTPHTRVAHYTQAIMDFGATLCTRSRPQCTACPVQTACVAKASDRQHQLPTPRAKRVRPSKSEFIVVWSDPNDRVLLERRPPAGIWGGLWVFPQFVSRDAAEQWLRSQGQNSDVPQLASYHHAFTHFDLELKPLQVRGPAGASTAMQLHDADRYCWYDARQPPRIGLATPVAAIIQQLFGSGSSLQLL